MNRLWNELTCTLYVHAWVSGETWLKACHVSESYNYGLCIATTMQGIKMQSVRLQSHWKTWASISWIMSVAHVNNSCSTQSSGTIISMIELSVVTISGNKTDAQVDVIHTCSDHLFEMANYQYTFWRPIHATKMRQMHGLEIHSPWLNL